MSRIFLTGDQRAFEMMQSYRLPVYRLSGAGEGMPDMRDMEIVVVGRNGDAKKAAFELASRGIAQAKLNYVEADGQNTLADLLKNPRHLYWDDVRPLAHAPAEDSITVYRSGIPCLDANVKWRLPELCVTAGPYASGKSLLAQILAINFVCENGEDGWGEQYDQYGVVLPKLPGCNALLCSWEDMPAKMRDNASKIASARGRDAGDILERVHYVCRDPNEDRLIAWFVDIVRYHHDRYNTRFFVLDPWNEIDHVKEARQSETDYVRDMMKAFRRLVDELKIILNVVTHVPAKLVRQDGAIEPFRLAHAFGSSQFANKADRGFCVVRSKTLSHDQSDRMAIRFDKVKIEPDMGVTGSVAFRYDRERCDLHYDAEATEELRGIWK